MNPALRSPEQTTGVNIAKLFDEHVVGKEHQFIADGAYEHLAGLKFFRK